jgi:signal transduction histidine kinase/CheY-like chemotaxis protein/HPt (histidine-containing phosphotransfer) domain-containing protein
MIWRDLTPQPARVVVLKSSRRHFRNLRRVLSSRGPSQLRLGFLLVGVIAVIPLALAQYHLSQQVRDYALAEAQHRLDLLASVALLAPSPTADAPFGLALTRHLQLRNDLVAFKQDPAGRIVASHPADVSREALSGRRTTPAGLQILDLDGTPYIVAAERSETTGEMVSIGQPLAIVMAPVEEQIRSQFLMVFAVFLGSVLIGLIGSEVLIFGPLTSLGKTAGALRSGDLTARTEVTGSGEVRELARAIDSLATTIEERQARLEAARQVAESASGRAERASQAKTDFLASMSHEIRTPLNGIVGYTELLLDGALTPEQRRYGERIEAAAGAVLTVVNDILDFSRIEAGHIELHPRPFLLAPLVDSTVSIVRAFASRKGIPVEVEFDESLPVAVSGDAARLRQVILNVLNNAVKFTREGWVRLKVTAAPGHLNGGGAICFTVSDTGIGIPADKRDRIFERFSQVQPATSEYGGTGLGLAISKHLVTEMGGEIGFESVEGSGSVFWVKVPLPVAEMPVHQGVPEGLGPAGRRLRILVADDLEMNTEIAASMLSAMGHEVDTVADGKQAVIAAANKVYDVILLDIQMQHMDGVSAAKEIREQESGSHQAYIIAMTANVLPQQIRAYRDAGMDDHIGKPFNRAALREKILPLARAEAAPAEEPDADVVAFDRSAYEDLERLLGAEQVSRWLSRLDEQLSGILGRLETSRQDRPELARQAHGLVSHAGSLGFRRVAESCRLLEEACVENSGDLQERIVYARAASREAVEILKELT